MSQPAEQGDSKDRKIGRHALLGTISNYTGQLITFATGFLMTPFLLHRLGQSDFGLWVLVGSLVSYATLFDFGITGALTKYIAEYKARGETVQARSLIATSLWLYTLFGLAVMVIAALIAPYFPVLFNVPVEDQEMTVKLVMLMGVGLGLSIPSGTTYAVLRGLQRFDYINLITITGTLLTALSTVLVLLSGGGLLQIAAVNIPVSLSMQIPSLWLIHKVAPDLKIGLRGARRRLVRQVFSYSSATMAIQTAGQLRNKTDELVVGAFLPVSSVTPYGIARRLSEAAQQLTYQFLRIILPLASQLEAEKDQARLRALYLTSTRLTLVIFLTIGVNLVALAGPLLSLWVGVEYAQYAYLVVILVAAGFVYMSQGPASMILQGVAKHRWLAVAAILSGILNLVLSIILVQRFGLVGVALGTLIPNLLEAFFFVLPYSLSVLKIEKRTIWREVLAPALIPAIPMVALLAALRNLLEPFTVFSVAALAGASSLLYLGVYFWMGASKVERQGIQDLFGGLAGLGRRLYLALRQN